MSSDRDPHREDRRSTPLSRLADADPRTRLVTATALVAAFAVAAFFLWPRAERLPDFSAYEEVGEMKRAFFSHLVPAVQAENRRVLDQRERLLDIIAGYERHNRIGWLDRRWLRRLAQTYAVEWDEEDPQSVFQALRRRVDMVPLPLALVQAATESGWGRSRFAVEGNNLFGQWCYTPGCGLVPANRAEGARHEVAAFDDVRAAVASYMRNLNTHKAYEPLRRLREQQRVAGETPDAETLIGGLTRYSERGADYVEEIRSVLRANRRIIEEVIESA